MKMEQGEKIAYRMKSLIFANKKAQELQFIVKNIQIQEMEFILYH